MFYLPTNFIYYIDLKVLESSANPFPIEKYFSSLMGLQWNYTQLWFKNCEIFHAPIAISFLEHPRQYKVFYFFIKPMLADKIRTLLPCVRCILKPPLKYSADKAREITETIPRNQSPQTIKRYNAFFFLATFDYVY